MHIYENKTDGATIAAILQGYISGGDIGHYTEPFARNFDVIGNIKCRNRLANNENARVCERLERTRCNGSRGVKKSELRYNDRDYAVDDMLILREYTGTEYTGRRVCVVITHILQNCGFGLLDGWEILSIKRLKGGKEKWQAK